MGVQHKDRSFGEFLRQLSEVAENAFSPEEHPRSGKTAQEICASYSRPNVSANKIISEQLDETEIRQEKLRQKKQQQHLEKISREKLEAEKAEQAKKEKLKTVAKGGNNRYTNFLKKNKHNVQDAIVLAEILGPPRAFRGFDY